MKKLIWIIAVLVSMPQMLLSMTTAGTVINNTAVVSYDIGGSTLTITRSLSFVVDYYADLLLANNNSGDTAVVPGQSQASIFFELKNEGNKDQGYTFVIDTTVAGDNFDPVALSCKVFDSSNVDISAGVTVAQESSIPIEVRCDIPAGLSSGDIGAIILLADNGLTNAPEADDPDLEQIVLADDAGVTDSQYDGKYTARGNYRVDPYRMQILKLSCPYSDPDVGISPSAQIKSGGVIAYVFDIHNTTALSFSALRVDDTLSTLLDPATLTDIRLESQVSQPCNCLAGQGNTVTGTTTTPTNTGSGANISIPIGNIIPGERKCLSFKVKIY